MFDTKKIKKILTALKGPDCGNVYAVPSPDGSHAVVFSHAWEMTMMNWSYCFTLLDKGLAVAEEFPKLTSIRTSCAWSSDSAFFAVPGEAWGGLLLWDVRRKSFALIRTGSRQFIFDFQGPDRLRVQCDPEQLRAINLGAGVSSSPVQRYKALPDSLIEVRTLSWHPREELSKADQLAKTALAVKAGLVKDGFFPFKGRFPASTTDVIDDRRLETFHLEAFAAFGDKQSQAWIDEIKRKVGEDRYTGAIVVSKLLGKRKRSIPPGV